MSRIDLPEGVSVHCAVDDFLWPWDKATPVLMMHGFARNARCRRDTTSMRSRLSTAVMNSIRSRPLPRPLSHPSNCPPCREPQRCDGRASAHPATLIGRTVYSAWR